MSLSSWQNKLSRCFKFKILVAKVGQWFYTEKPLVLMLKKIIQLLILMLVLSPHKYRLTSTKKKKLTTSIQIECANHDFKTMHFPFFMFYFPFYVFFFTFLGSIRKSDLRSSLNLKVCWLNCFYLF